MVRGVDHVPWRAEVEMDAQTGASKSGSARRTVDRRPDPALEPDHGGEMAVVPRFVPAAHPRVIPLVVTGWAPSVVDESIRIVPGSGSMFVCLQFSGTIGR